MNKFRRYKCDTCGKEVDLENNITHAFIDRCTLTKGCLGRLRLVGEKNSKDNILNFESFVQTDSIAGKAKSKDLPQFIDASSNDANDFVVAVRRSTAYSPNSILQIQFEEILNTEQSYSEFIFNLNVPFSAISGKDSSVEQRVLMFDESDSVVIFINGKEIDSTTYTLENNVVRFNSTIVYGTFGSSSVFVKVLVFSRSQTIAKHLNFRKNVAGLSTNAWSNVNSIQIGQDIYDVFTSVDDLSIDLNTRLIPKSAAIAGIATNLNDVIILLSEKPYERFDRIVTRVVRLSDLDSSVDLVKYELVNSSPRFLVTSNSISDIFPPIFSLDVFDMKTESAIVSTVGDDTSLNRNITNNNKFVLGPI